jgi:transposase
MRGHSCATHRAISDSSRSTAWRLGRCRLHPSRPVSRRHTEARANFTPVTRSTTAPARSNVHRSASNPCAWAPCSNAAPAATGTVIPQPVNQVENRLRRGSAGGRPPGFDAEAYKQRNAVERCINRLKQWRGLAMRTDKLAIAYQAALHLAAILIWTRRCRPRTEGSQS